MSTQYVRTGPDIPAASAARPEHDGRMTLTTDVAVHPHHRHGWWWKTLLAGFLL
ncbi:hypothetical protein [Curtobacterium citreum]|uniref:hypothetical protein n=1 Tax=Curtobacterium citreum TaxID=2036 RepID=UPI001FEA68ED|nr:hypothetical protein [Curtobacterium albidum]